MPLALEGVKVIEMGPFGPANIAGQYLADLGADVVVVESPHNRALGPEWNGGDRFRPETNRNKRMIVLELNHDEGKNILHKLVKESDVLFEANRPGGAKRLGFDYETLSAINPKIIVASLTHFGQSGPYARRASHVVVYEALGGWLQTYGTGMSNMGGDYTGKPWVDRFAIVGIKATYNFSMAILAALFARERTGIGQYIDMAILDSVTTVRRQGTPPKDEEVLAEDRPEWNVYECKDGKYMAVAASEDLQWRNLCQGLGVPELGAQTPSSIRRGGGDLQKTSRDILAALQRAFKTKTRDEWSDILSKFDTEVGKVQTLDEVAHDPHVKHRGMHVEVLGQDGYRDVQYGAPYKLSKTPARTAFRRAPRVGEYSDQILAELGYSQSEIHRLREAKIAY